MKKVMLASNEKLDINTIQYPVLASGKIDGLRGIVQEGQLVSRSLKSTINRHVTGCLSHSLFEGLDGELTVPGIDWNNFDVNQSTFMTQSGEPKFIFHVFDDMSCKGTAIARKAQAKIRVSELKARGFPVEFCEQHMIHNPSQLLMMYEEFRAKGYEGLIMVAPNGQYKHGRSTTKQGLALKLKPSEDSEGVIIGMEELMTNLDAGNSKKLENLVPGGVMGTLLLRWNGKAIKIGTGFTYAQRLDMFQNLDKYLGKLAKFKYMELTKSGEPRHAVFVGIRHKDDL